MKLRTATIIFDNKEAFIIAIKRVKEALLSAWEQTKEPFLIFTEELLKAAREIDRRLKEREVVAIEGGFNIHSNERR
jgi:alanine dehydrogenase